MPLSPHQHPIDSGLTASATALDVVENVDLRGRRAIVTGGHSGVGLETTRALAAAGAQVVVPVRFPDKGRQRLAGIDGVEIDELDLADPDSITRFAARTNTSGRALDILVNSAGVMGIPTLELDSRGNERHFATNFLGHFQLVNQLWPALRAGRGARVVNVSAWAHRMSPVVFDDPAFKNREYQWWSGYGQSKTANVLHAVAISKRGADDGIEAFAVHPGSIVDTNLSGSWATLEVLKASGLVDDDGNPLIDPENGKKTPQQGASTQTWAATNPALGGLGGVYAENNDISPVVKMPDPDEMRQLLATGDTPIGVVAHAIDIEQAELLWNLGARLTGADRTSPLPGP